MNSKAMALLAVVVMIASGAVAFVSMPSEVEATGDGSEDSPYDLGTVYVDGSASASVDVKYNQSAYAGLPHKVTLSATVTPADGEASTATPIYVMTSGSAASTTSKTAGGLSFTTDNDTVGIIGVTVASANTATNSSYTVEFKLDVVINPDNLDKSSSLTLESVYYTLDVNVRVGGTLVVEAAGDVTTFTENNDSTVSYNVKLDKSDHDYITGTDYEWYAYNLPEGLSISGSTNGFTIGGLPTAATENAASVSIVARDKTTGAEYSGSLSITVVAEGTVKITLIKGEDDVLVPTGGNEYYVMSKGTGDDAITLQVESDKKPTVSAIEYETGSLSRAPLDVSGSGTDVDPYECGIPTEGAGVYYIEVSIGTNVQVLKINVAINPTGAPGAGFTIESNP